ncbi:hypothetical protein Y032_0016g2986 [Ancylostoma ceylanicum]|uniref:Uncharacterized protein n=1 Tax=Ancylostoma ceylanicum TaxID=53326 RepID=A0A016V592_9BILA|nr:hypothetical protein Y032_0016g2986 [Ancylostoma ceylanicum]
MLNLHETPGKHEIEALSFARQAKDTSLRLPRVNVLLPAQTMNKSGCVDELTLGNLNDTYVPILRADVCRVWLTKESRQYTCMPRFIESRAYRMKA